MPHKKGYSQPSDVTVEDGIVRVMGPDHVDVRMTAEAADETSERLLYGAMQALGKKIPELASDEKAVEEADASD